MLRTTLGAAALSLMAGSALAGSYSVTVSNNLSEELLAPILITNAGNDSNIFMGTYVTPEAEEQILTGDPAKLVARIGPDAMVGHGTDGPPGVLLAPGKSVTFDIETDATSVRVISMVAPTLLPDTYVTNVVDLSGSETIEAHLNRFDIGHDEGTRMIFKHGEKMMEGETMASDSMASDGTMSSDSTMASDGTIKSDDAMAMAEHQNSTGVSIVFVKKM